MKVLELFSGTGSIGKVFKERGHDVLSLDITDKLGHVDIITDIMDWDYKTYPVGAFDCVWASPPCRTFSILRNSHIGRTGSTITAEKIESDIVTIGLPILRKAQEIITYFKPNYWFIENPQTGRMKQYIIDIPFYDVNYCKYGFPYKKSTRIWTNLLGFEPLVCKYDCPSSTGKKHNVNVGRSNIRRKDSYKIPEPLTNSIIDCMI
jgi:site-specific DNA-cytosine methylase